MCRHDEIGLHEPAARRDEPPDERRRHRERRIGHDSKRPAGESQVRRVGHDDHNAVALETISQVTDSLAVQLDGDDSRASLDQQAREDSSAGADVEHEIAGIDGGFLYEECRPSVIELVKAPPALLPPGHGGP
jgi:hypothetical protein